MNKLYRVVPMLVLMAFLSACVTINVYFPAAATEEAADRIIKDVLGEAAQTSSLQAPKSASPLLLSVLEALVPVAQAADINVSTPAISTLRASMKARFKSLEAFLSSGAVGFSRDGLVAVKNLKAVSLKARSSVKKLVAAENADRSALYREIANGNGHPEWEQEIRSTFAARWVTNARSGWWYQNSGGTWKQK